MQLLILVVKRRFKRRSGGIFVVLPDSGRAQVPVPGLLMLAAEAIFARLPALPAPLQVAPRQASARATRARDTGGDGHPD